MTIGSLFSGIGGFDLAFEREGFGIAWQVEWDEWCRRVLAKHWPNVPKYGDIHHVGSHNLEYADVIVGGFPCQPFSAAGKRKGTEDDRYLWPEMLRVIREIRPRYVVGENVAGLVTWDDGLVLDTVLSDLEAEGYETIPPLVIPACATGADHRRDRVWIVAYTESDGRERKRLPVQPWRSRQARIDADGSGAQSRRCGHWTNKPSVCRMVHGLSSELDRRRIAALGNAIVPQVAMPIARAIREHAEMIARKEAA